MVRFWLAILNICDCFAVVVGILLPGPYLSQSSSPFVCHLSVCPESTSRKSKSTLSDRATFAGKKSASSSANSAWAAAIAASQQAVKDFDDSAEGKERKALDAKNKNSKTQMTAQDATELETLNRRRASLTRARDAAKEEKDDDDIAAAVKALADFDASECSGKKRSKLMQKNRHSKLQMSAEEQARLKELDLKRKTLGQGRALSQTPVFECRKTLQEFDESAEGKERKALDEKHKNAGTKLTAQDSRDLEKLNQQRGSLTAARDAAKRGENEDDIAAALKALADFDASKRGRQRKNLLVKQRWSRLHVSPEESARLGELDKKRAALALKLNRASSTASTNRSSTMPATASRNSARSKEGERTRGSRKDPPEQFVGKYSQIPQLRKPAIDRNGAPYHPVHDVHNSKVAAILLSEDLPCNRTTKESSAHKKRTASVAALSEEEDEVCGLCFTPVDIWGKSYENCI